MNGRGLIVVLAALALVAGGFAGDTATEAKKEGAPATWAPAVEPKPLSQNAERGIAFLVKTQNKDGGWGQGEESKHMGTGLAHLTEKSNVADTCAATLALIRAGSTPSKGPHAEQVRKGLGFLCAQIEKADSPSLWITETRGTRLQQKLGQYIDTFLAALVLSEAKGQMPDEQSNKRVFAALDKVMDKIEKNQRSDGTWADDGWAPTLAQAMAAKAISRADQAGRTVSEGVRAKVETFAADQFDAGSAKFAARGSAGVELYSGAATLGALRDADNTNEAKIAKVRDQAANGATEAEREEAKAILQRFEATKDSLQSTQKAIVEKLDDERFIKGFGSNGGEEFLSYMNIGESLVVKGGEEWQKWDASMTANLNRIQNQDGSWTGHHCITGRTFCTAAALLVLTTDRAPVPLAAKFRKR